MGLVPERENIIGEAYSLARAERQRLARRTGTQLTPATSAAPQVAQLPIARWPR